MIASVKVLDGHCAGTLRWSLYKCTSMGFVDIVVILLCSTGKH